MVTITISEACRAELHAATAPPDTGGGGGTEPGGGEPGGGSGGTGQNPADFDKVLQMAFPAWTIGPAANRHLYTATAGHMGPKDAVVIAITTPAVLVGDAFGSIGWTEISSTPVQQRMVVLSDVPLDFTKGLPGIGAITPAAETGSTNFSAGPNSAGYPALAIPNHTYYLNVKNVNLVPSPIGHYDLDFEFRNPK